MPQLKSFNPIKNFIIFVLSKGGGGKKLQCLNLIEWHYLIAMSSLKKSREKEVGGGVEMRGREDVNCFCFERGLHPTAQIRE